MKPKKIAAGKLGLRVPTQRLIRLSEVNMAPYNPRVMPPERMIALKASLLRHGMVLNLVMQERGMVLIGGHQRVRAMRELCADKGWPEPSEVPATVLDVGDAEARQLNVALNRIEGDFDPYKLGELFKDMLPTMTVDDVLSTGFRAEELDELIKLTAAPGDIADGLEDGIGALDGFAKSITLSVEFDTTEDRDKAKELLKAMAESSKRKAGTVLLKHLRASVPARPGVHNGKRQSRPSSVV